MPCSSSYCSAFKEKWDFSVACPREFDLQSLLKRFSLFSLKTGPARKWVFLGVLTAPVPQLLWQVNAQPLSSFTTLADGCLFPPECELL